MPGSILISRIFTEGAGPRSDINLSYFTEGVGHRSDTNLSHRRISQRA